jgi:AraC family transcriptional regulator of adaptative response / DNA-3-methyladenine glycosylase II
VVLDRTVCYRALRTRDARFDGRFFTGVKTTGIYCRPICPARTPKLENVAFFPSAAAAQEAGFRPCLRCRPECSPELGSARGTSNTVHRALRLIEAGALDGGDVDALATRLGVGERHLRRLFGEHLGASPIAVAQTRRVLLAKRLLHDTDLKMTEVALASGFGSVRRFNETFQRLFGRPPSRLRRSTRARPSASPSGAITLTLDYREPYDWKAAMTFLAPRAIPGVEVVTPNRYARTIEIDGARGMFEVAPSPSGASLRATLRLPRVSALPDVLDRIRRLFDLSADPNAIGAQLREDPTLAPLVATRPGLRVPGAWDGFELGVRAILGQQISVAGATRLAGRLVAAFGERWSDGAVVPGLDALFPRPERLAKANLARLGIPRARAAAIRSLAEAACSDPRLFQPRGTLEASVDRLRHLPGVGDWTAQYIAMRALGETDALPASDLGLLRGIARDGRSKPSPASLVSRAERWRPWRAYGAMHLWAAGAAGHTNIQGDLA